jgi:ankyrin repeat protein
MKNYLPIVGGGQPEVIWNQSMKSPTFHQKLLKDPSLHRLGCIKSDGSLDFDKIKSIFFKSDSSGRFGYLKWILEGYIDGGNHLLEDIQSQMASTLTEFDSLKKRGLLKGIDYFKYCGLYGCRRKNADQLGLLSLVEPFQKNLSKSAIEQHQKQNAELLYQNDQIMIIHPKDKEAAIYYGKGTRWCTSAQKGENMFQSYNKEGPLYIIIPKKPTRDREKYQLHLQTTSLMNELDGPMSKEDYLKYYDSLNQFIETLSVDPQKINDSFQSMVDNGNLYFPMLDILLQKGANPNVKDEEDNTLLILADIEEDRDLIFLLLEYGANPNIPGFEGSSAFHYMVQSKDYEMMEFMLQKGADPNAPELDGNNTPLHLARNAKIVDLLLEYGAADINIRDQCGDTPLVYRLRAMSTLRTRSSEDEQERYALIKKLLEKGADPNIRGKHGDTPLQLAPTNEISQLLLDYGANPNVVNDQKKAPLL